MYLCVSVSVHALDAQDLVSLVVGSLEREGVRMLQECEPREVKREGETGRLEVCWYNKNTGETEQVSKVFLSYVRLTMLV